MGGRGCGYLLGGNCWDGPAFSHTPSKSGGSGYQSTLAIRKRVSRMENDVTEQERISRAASMLGQLGASKGGKTSSANMTKAQRKDRAARAVAKRWENWRKKNPDGAKVQTYVGQLEQALLHRLNRTGTVEVACDDRKRPTNRREYNAALKLVASGQARKVAGVVVKHGARITLAKI